MKIKKFLNDLLDDGLSREYKSFDTTDCDIEVRDDGDSAPAIRVDSYIGPEGLRRAAKMFNRLADQLEERRG